MAALHADEGGYLTSLEGVLHVVGGEGELKGIGVSPDEVVDDVYLLHRRADILLGRARCRDVHGPELAAQSSLLQACDVRVQVGLRLTDVDPRYGAADSLTVLPGKVVVPVD